MGIGLLLGGSNVGHSLGEAAVLEGLVRVECSVHTGRCVLKCHVSVSTVLGHGGTDLAELRCSLGRDLLDLVVRILAEALVLRDSLGSELGAALLGLLSDMCHFLVEAVHCLLEVLAGLGILLDLGRVGSNVFVSLLNLGIRSRSKSGKSTLLCGHGQLQLLGGMGLVLTHDLAGLVGAPM